MTGEEEGRQKGEPQGAVDSFLETSDQAGFENVNFFFFWYENLHSSLLQDGCPALNNAALKRTHLHNCTHLLHA